MSRILLVYPNSEGYPIIPIGLSLLSGVLKRHGHQVELFDATFLMSQRFDHEAREKTNVVEKVNVREFWGEGGGHDLEEKLQSQIAAFKPQIVAFSIIEDNYQCARRLCAVARAASRALIVVGGYFPTVAPQYFQNDPNIDLICSGEGEYALTELADALDKKADITGIKNLNGNPLSRYYDWEPNVHQDWTIFDERHLLKPFMGKMRRTGFFEMSRGCPYQCSYCVNHIFQEKNLGLGSYNRQKPIAYAIDEITRQKQQYGLDLVFFNDENFLSMSAARLADFCQQYRREVALPFYVCTRADSLLNENNVELLREAGCHTVGIGVETGNEELRFKVLNKKIKNDVYEKAFKNCHKYGLRTTANIMIGFPYETEANIMESADFIRRLEARSLSISIFAPYYGTKLREVCIAEGYMGDELYGDIGIVNNSILKMPQISAARLEELYLNFNDLVYSNTEVK